MYRRDLAETVQATVLSTDDVKQLIKAAGETLTLGYRYGCTACDELERSSL